MLKPAELKKFSEEFTKLFATNEYKAMAQDLGIEAFDKGACEMVARSLQSVLGGTLFAIAMLEKSEDYADWPLQHFILKHGKHFIDNTGIHTRTSAVEAVKKVMGENNVYRIGPLNGKWSYDGLWVGEHLYSSKVANRLKEDAQRILQEVRVVVP